MSGDAFDPKLARQDFPALAQEVNGKPLAFLDSGASTQKPRQVIDELARFYREDYANIHRGVYELSRRSTVAYENARKTVATFLNAPSAAECIFVRSTTEAINLVAQCYALPKLKAGDEILITTLEHHSNIVPWQMICARTGAKLKVVPINDAGELEMAAVDKMLNNRTRLFAFNYVSNALGTVNPAKELVELAHSNGTAVLVDGAQSAPHTAVDVQALDCDFYAFSGHKVYGPSGIGVLYGKADLLNNMPPYQGGGDMIRSVSFENTVYNVIPARFEAGTPNIAGAVGLDAALKYIMTLGLDNIAAHEAELLEYATNKIAAIPGLRIIGTAKQKAAVISFVIEGIDSETIGTILDKMGVAVRTGHHCTEPLMARMGVPATARASLGLYNTREDIDALLAGLEKVIQIAG